MGPRSVSLFHIRRRHVERHRRFTLMSGRIQLSVSIIPAGRETMRRGAAARLRRSGCRLDVCTVEIVAFEQQRDLVVSRRRVGEAVAEIELCRMAAPLSIAGEGRER